tara:strand:- start:558 stop:1652 length:1095 start_codon:yes stop_codon:yes gene_type:complete
MTVSVPLLPVLAAEFQTSIGYAGIIVTAFALPYGAVQILLGPVGDKFGKLRVIAGSLALSTIFVLGSGTADSIEYLATMRFFSGLSMAGTIPLAMAYIADEVPYETRQLVIGRYINGVVLGHIAGGVLGGFAAEYLDWRHIFFLFAGLCLLFSFFLFNKSSVEKIQPGRISIRSTMSLYRSVLLIKKSRQVIITGTLEGVFIFGIFAYFGAYLRDSYDLGYGTVGLILGAYGLGGLFYAMVVPYLVRSLGELKMIGLGSFFLGMSFLSFGFIARWEFIVPVFFFAGFSFYVFHNTMQTHATEIAPDARGAGVSFWAFMLFFGQGFGVTIFGIFINNFGYKFTFSLAGCGIALLGWWFRSQLADR